MSICPYNSSIHPSVNPYRQSLVHSSINQYIPTISPLSINLSIYPFTHPYTQHSIYYLPRSPGKIYLSSALSLTEGFLVGEERIGYMRLYYLP